MLIEFGGCVILLSSKDCLVPPEEVTHLIYKQPLESNVPIKERKRHEVNMHELDVDISWGVFDEVIQGHPFVGGIGTILTRNSHLYSKFKYAVGRVSNNKEKIVALLLLLYVE